MWVPAPFQDYLVDDVKAAAPIPQGADGNLVPTGSLVFETEFTSAKTQLDPTDSYPF